MSGLDKHLVAPVGSTGNNTHTGVNIGVTWQTVLAQFVVSAIGATPTVTFKFQGSLDSTNGIDGNWYDVGYVDDVSDTYATATKTRTTVGASIIFLKRPYKWIRLVTSSNTNVTYSGEVYLDR